MRKNKSDKDTIAAIATPQGIGGLSLIRISGTKAIRIANKIFKAKNKKSLLKARSHTLIYGYIVDPFKDKEFLDEVLLSVMRAPRTYTRENVVEISCHGGLVAARAILEVLLKLDIRLAEPGEFTKRAFINGRIDLAQAEAVYDIINAKTDKCLQLAFEHLKGNFSDAVKELANGILELITDLEAAIDFDAQHIKSLTEKKLQQNIKQKKAILKRMIAEADYGIVINEGISVVICGKANVGKSSLMNAFLKTEKVIVSPIAGTTRDTIEEIINIKGVALRFIDTAGMIKSSGLLETKSVEKTIASLERADLALLILDASKRITADDIKIMKLISNKPHIVALNKTDLKNNINLQYAKDFLKNKEIIRISATEKRNLDKLEEKILRAAFSGQKKNINSQMINNLRQKELAKKSYEALERADKSLGENLSYEFIALDLREALNYLLAITGETVSIDILDRIFKKFCVGK
jgi:tRNA modification GTPase